ncbi:MAG: hypothetical protein ABIJ97_09810, partial [Bacteroidota bacterium]
MKTLAFTIILIILSTNLFSQETEEKENLFTNKHELSIYFSNILTKQEFTWWPYYYYYDYDYDDFFYLQLLQSQPIYGIGYKLHFIKGALRVSIGGSYDNAKQDFEDNDDYPSVTNA